MSDPRAFPAAVLDAAARGPDPARALHAALGELVDSCGTLRDLGQRTGDPLLDLHELGLRAIALARETARSDALLGGLIDGRNVEPVLRSVVYAVRGILAARHERDSRAEPPPAPSVPPQRLN